MQKFEDVIAPEENCIVENCFEDTERRFSSYSVYFINESNLKSCPRASLRAGDKRFTAILDSGAEIFVISEMIYDRLVESGIQILTILVVQGVLISAWGSKTKRIRKTGVGTISD
jgi:hypothetical protein